MGSVVADPPTEQRVFPALQRRTTTARWAENGSPEMRDKQDDRMLPNVDLDDEQSLSNFDLGDDGDGTDQSGESSLVAAAVAAVGVQLSAGPTLVAPLVESPPSLSPTDEDIAATGEMSRAGRAPSPGEVALSDAGSSSAAAGASRLDIASPTPQAHARMWLAGMLERGVEEGLDPAPHFRGHVGDAAARIQGAARARAARLQYSDMIQTALVMKLAKQQMQACKARAEAHRQQQEQEQQRKQGFSTPNAKSEEPSLNDPSRLAIGSIAGAPAPGDFARAQQAKSFTLPTQFMGSTARELRPQELHPPPKRDAKSATEARRSAGLQRTASTAERLKLLHALAQVQTGGTARNAFIDEDGNPRSKQYVRLARSQHWRRCPVCQCTVEHRDSDGSASCPECDEPFRWLAAEAVVPVTSLRELRVETRWQYDEIASACGCVTTRDVARLYWLSNWTPLTRSGEAKLFMYRAAIALPLLTALPLLRYKAAVRTKRLMLAQQEVLPTMVPLTANPTEVDDPRTGLPPTMPLFISLPGERGTGADQSSSLRAVRVEEARLAFIAQQQQPPSHAARAPSGRPRGQEQLAS